MKREVSPAIVAVIIVIVLGIAFFVIMKGTGNPGSKGPGEVGNPSPFSPGGAAFNAYNKGGGRPPQSGAAPQPGGGGGANPSPFNARPSSPAPNHS